MTSITINTIEALFNIARSQNSPIKGYVIALISAAIEGRVMNYTNALGAIHAAGYVVNVSLNDIVRHHEKEEAMKTQNAAKATANIIRTVSFAETKAKYEAKQIKDKTAAYWLGVMFGAIKAGNRAVAIKTLRFIEEKYRCCFTADNVAFAGSAATQTTVAEPETKAPVTAAVIGLQGIVKTVKAGKTEQSRKLAYDFMRTLAELRVLDGRIKDAGYNVGKNECVLVTHKASQIAFLLANIEKLAGRTRDAELTGLMAKIDNLVMNTQAHQPAEQPKQTKPNATVKSSGHGNHTVPCGIEYWTRLLKDEEYCKFPAKVEKAKAHLANLKAEWDTTGLQSDDYNMLVCQCGHKDHQPVANSSK